MQRRYEGGYPEGVRAKRLKPMYEKDHPLKGLDTAPFGKPTEGVKDPKYPRKWKPEGLLFFIASDWISW